MTAQRHQWGHYPDLHGQRDEYDEYTYQVHDYGPRRSRSNRASIQTSNTDGLTESTFGPHSPTASSFAGAAQGLAPRPPSYQHGRQMMITGDGGAPSAAAAAGAIDAHQVDVDVVAPAPSSSPSPPSKTHNSAQEVFLNFPGHMSRRQKYPSAEKDQEASEPTVPAAQDVPPVSPVSHRQPHAHAGLYTSSLPPLFQSLPFALLVDDGEMDPEGNYTTLRQEYPDIVRHQIHHVTNRKGNAVPHGQTQDAATGPPPPRESLNDPSERHKKFANDRSPLQRLELTLDSMTKEEKRARVQAAEQRARERAARRAAKASANPPSDLPNRTLHSEHQLYPSAPIAQGLITSKQEPCAANTERREQSYSKRQTQPHLSPPQPSFHPHVADRSQLDASPPAIVRPGYDERPSQPRSNLPNRNLSFRERAVHNEEEEPKVKARSPSNQQTAFFTGGQNGGQSNLHDGINKLRKKHLPDQSYLQRAQSTRETTSAGIARPPTSKSPRALAIIKDKELPPVPVTQQPAIEIQRRATEPAYERQHAFDEEDGPRHMHVKALSPPVRGPGKQTGDAAATSQRPLERQDSGQLIESVPQHRIPNRIFKNPESLHPGQGLYKAPVWLDEHEKATIGFLGGTLLDLSESQIPAVDDKNKAWWEGGSRDMNTAYSSRPRKAEAFDGEYDDTNAPTRFKPPLYLKCGPLLRYSGIRHEKVPTKTQTSSAVTDREIWRGSMMIVTQDSKSSYDIAPILRLFVQDIGLLPPPPHQVNGELPGEYVDPIAGHPKLGRTGETLYVRPVEHLKEAKDLSLNESDEGLFERYRSLPDLPLPDGAAELPQSFAGRQKRIETDGEKLQKYKDVRGFRLHAERGCTFWRFNIEIELREKQQRIAYRINRGPCMAFWVPARANAMNMMFHSCNGFSTSVNPDDLSGPDPMWRDVLNNHQSQPFHVMIGGGDQIYNDSVAHKCVFFDEWLDIGNPRHKHIAAFTAEMQDEMEAFYLGRYCMWFSRGLFALAASQIPMINMYDDHDIFDGYGSYPDQYMKSPVFTGLGAVAFKYYMLFQHQTVLTETENMEPSWLLGVEPGPYIKELSRSMYISMGGKVALLAVDCRTERTEQEVIKDKTWEKIMNRLYAEVRRGQVEHLLVLLGVPIAYPRLVWLENILTSRFMDPVKALGRTGMFGKALNNIDGGVEVLDDLNDHWTAKNHKQERSIIIEDLQDLAIDKSLRITILSGDVHLAAVGQFYSNPKFAIPKHKDPRYMVNVISSAIANTPPSNMLADVLNKRNKVHHFDKKTEESMVPLFQHGVDGKPRNNKHLLPHRNWCSIRAWTPGMTPPPTPPLSAYDGSPSPPSVTNGNSGGGSGGNSGGGLFRRLSLGGGGEGRSTSNRFEGSRTSVRGSKPPISGGMGGLFRSFSRRNSADGPRPGKLTRTVSLGSSESGKKGIFNIGRRNMGGARPSDGGINGQWGEDSDEDDYFVPQPHQSLPSRTRPSGLRGGGTYEYNEFSEDDEAHFTARPPRRAQTLESQQSTRLDRNEVVKEDAAAPPRPFHRTPTGLSAKQMRQAEQLQVDVEGGLDICLNVEVNAKDPAGITVPYRLLVPRLQYEYNPAEDELQHPTISKDSLQPSGIRKFLSFRKRAEKPKPEPRQDDGYDEETDNDEDYPSDASSEMAPQR